VTWEGRGVFEVSSADPDSTSPVWVDFTSRIRDVIQPPTLATGRQNDLEQSEPSVFTATLDNVDDALTYGNTASPYPWWGPGRKCRYREVIAGTNMALFTGFLLVPTELQATSGLEQRVQITAVDRLGRLATAETFVSTLDAHIKYNGGSALVAHWPMSDAAGALSAASLVTGVGPILQVTNYNDSLVNSQLLWANRAGPRGDDASYVQLNPTAAVIANNYVGRPRLVRRDISVPMTAGTVVAFLAWIYIPVDTTQPAGPGQVLVSHPNGSSNPTVQLRADIGTTGWNFQFADAGHALTTVAVPAVKTDAWSLVGAFMDVDASTITIFADGQTATASLGAPAFAGTFQEIALDGFAGQSFGPVQIYTGTAAQLNQAFFAAQYQMGLLGMERQSTGDRIRTVAQYAGIPATELTQIDTGQSVMQRALLAGQTPLDAMRDAERTEQGLLYVDGSGNLIFKDRRTLYNI